MTQLIHKLLSATEDDAKRRAAYALLHGIHITDNFRTGRLAGSFNYDHSTKELTLLIDPQDPNINTIIRQKGYALIDGQYKKVISYRTKVSTKLLDIILKLNHGSLEMIEIQVVFSLKYDTPEHEHSGLRTAINQTLDRSLKGHFCREKMDYATEYDNRSYGIIELHPNSRRLIMDLKLSQEGLVKLINIFHDSGLQFSHGTKQHRAFQATDFQVLKLYSDHRTGAHCIFQRKYEGVPHAIEFEAISEGGDYLEMGIQKITNLKTGSVIEDGTAITEFYSGEDIEINYEYGFKNAIENHLGIEISCG